MTALGDVVKKCPYCAETIQSETVRCRFCEKGLSTKMRAFPGGEPSDPLRNSPLLSASASEDSASDRNDWEPAVVALGGPVAAAGHTNAPTGDGNGYAEALVITLLLLFIMGLAGVYGWIVLVSAIVP